MNNPSSFVQYKDLPNTQSMFGNIGNSWNNPLPNDLYIKGVPKNVFSGGSFIGNVGLGLDTLLSLVFPANSLKNNLDLFKASFGGGFSAGGSNDDNKRIQLGFGGVILFNSGLCDLDSFGWWLDLLLVRLSNTQFNYTINVNFGQVVIDSAPTLSSSTGSLITGRNGNIITLSGSTTFSGNNQTLLLEAESAAAVDNNIFVNTWDVELTRS